MKFDFKTQTDETSPYIHAFNYCMQHLIWRFIIPFPYWRFYKTKGTPPLRSVIGHDRNELTAAVVVVVV
jgi:hypothetical protein